MAATAGYRAHAAAPTHLLGLHHEPLEHGAHLRVKHPAPPPLQLRGGRGGSRKDGEQAMCCWAMRLLLTWHLAQRPTCSPGTQPDAEPGLASSRSGHAQPWWPVAAPPKTARAAQGGEQRTAELVNQLWCGSITPAQQLSLIPPSPTTAGFAPTQPAARLESHDGLVPLHAEAQGGRLAGAVADHCAAVGRRQDLTHRSRRKARMFAGASSQLGAAVPINLVPTARTR